MILKRKKYLLPADMPVTRKEKLTFVVGSGGFLYGYIMFSSLILFYFTDILCISGTATGLLMLVAKIWDGINDPMMGIIIDRTNSRWGKVRPYVFCGGIGLAIFTVLLFTNPGLQTETSKIAWAFFTYVGWGMCYTMFLISLKLLPARLTRDKNGITELSSKLFVGTSIWSILVAYTLMNLINFFSGEANNAVEGYQKTAILGAGILCVTTCILSTLKERDFQDDGNKKEQYSVRTAVRVVFQNKPYMGFCLSTIFMYFGYFLAASTVVYYCLYNLKNQALYTPLTIIDYGTPIVAALAIPVLIKKIDKKYIAFAGLVAMVLGYGLRYITYDTNVYFMCIFAIIAGIGIGFYNVLFIPLALDCAAISEKREGINFDGLFVSSFTLMQKITGGIAGAFLGFMLDKVGYVEGALTQNANVLYTFRLFSTAGVVVTGTAACIAFFTLYKNGLEK